MRAHGRVGHHPGVEIFGFMALFLIAFVVLGRDPERD
jgi:hypothetical protein